MTGQIAMQRGSTQLNELMRRAAAGDEIALESLIDGHRDDLLRMVQAGLSPQLRGRVDASDIVQEAHLEIARRLDAYLEDPQAPFFLWLRSIVRQKLIDAHRQHLGAELRAATRDRELRADGTPVTIDEKIDNLLGDSVATPSQVAVRAEGFAQIRAILATMDPLDREVLTLRHFEQLSNVEIARNLSLTQSGASARYIRALKRFKERLMEFESGSW